MSFTQKTRGTVLDHVELPLHVRPTQRGLVALTAVTGMVVVESSEDMFSSGNQITHLESGRKSRMFLNIVL